MPSVPWHRHSPGHEEAGTGHNTGSSEPIATPGSATSSASKLQSLGQQQADRRRVSPSGSAASMTPITAANSQTSQTPSAIEAAQSGMLADEVGSAGQGSTPGGNGKVIGKLRVQVVGAHDLIGKDRNGLSDPFVVLNLPGAPPTSSARRDRNYYRRTTPVQPKTLNPTWKESEATFEWDITTDWLPSSSDVQVIAHALSPHTDELAVSKEASSAVKPQAGAALSVPTTEVAVSSSGSAVPTRPSSVRKISAATGRILIAPMRMSAKGAIATSRVVRRRGRPRPIRLRKGQAYNKAPAGSAALSAHAASFVSAIEFVCWDKDRWSGNDYLGECSLTVTDWIPEGKSAAWDASEPVRLPLGSSRRHAKVSGEIIVKVGIVPVNVNETADDLYVHLLDASIQSSGAGVRSVPADQSVGTAGPTEAFVDDGLSSESESEAQEELLYDEEDGDRSVTSDEGDTATTETDEPYESDHSVRGLDRGHIQHQHIPIPPVQAAGKTEDEILTEPEAQQASHAVAPRRRRIFPTRLRKSRSVIDVDGGSAGSSAPGSGIASGATSDVADEASNGTRSARKGRIGVRRRRRRTIQKDDSTASQLVSGTAKATRKQRRREARQQRQDYAFKAQQGLDIIGIVQLEVKGAQDLPHWKNSLGTSFDMDAFVIVSFGQRIFRTRVARHSLNPVWDEKLLFHVRRHEANYVTKLAIYDWDKLSSNDYVGESELRISDLIERAPKPDPTTGLYAADEDTIQDMETFRLPLARHEDSSAKSLGRHSPVLICQARFTPYAALRQRFWRQILRQYDSNDSGSISVLELMAMLDSLGSTLTQQTIEGLFARFNKNAEEGDELTIDEAIIALEAEIVKPFSQKRVVDSATAIGGLDTINPTPLESGAQTPALEASLTGDMLTLPSSVDFAGPQAPTADESDLAARTIPVPPANLDAPASRGVFTRQISHDASKQSVLSSTSSASSNTKREQTTHSSSSTQEVYGGSKDDEYDGQVERVIKLKSCPMCRMPRLSKKAEVDIVTHLAVCASQDWRRVDSMMVGNYVTAMQAHRKWVTKVITKLSSGQYRLGANSANIIVQNRMTGEMLEEKMQVYVRLGIRLLYKGARSRMEGARIKRMLKNMSIKQGLKYDSPLSAREIPHFIAFHSLDVDEIRDPLDSFRTFNEFFYRKLKDGARPNADPDDPNTLVSSADCRLMAFSTVSEATQVWIKGRGFSIERLFGNGFLGSKPEDLDRYRSGGGLVIFRLAPQDYHRFHCPADATVGKITFIEGQYYTVNPMAIRSAIDVYCENVRAVVPFHSKQFGTFYCVCIGAMMVGSIRLTVEEGEEVKRGQEMGYFSFGGSTLVIVFEQGRVLFDEDLLGNSDKAIETLVRVGMRIGRSAAAEEQGGAQGTSG